MATQNDRSDDWIFADADPGTLPTERLPDMDAFEGVGSPLSRRAGSGRTESPTGSGATAGEPTGSARGDGSGSAPAVTSHAGPQERDESIESLPTTDLSGMREQIDRMSAERAASGTGRADGTGRPHGAGSRAAAEPGLHPEGAAPAPLRVPTYARSGTTPSAADEDPRRASVLPARFHDLGIFDAMRDLLALVCLVAALTTTFTTAQVGWLDLTGRIGIGVGILALGVAHGLRWIPRQPPLRAVRMVRVFGLLPAVAAALLVIGADIVTSIPVMFAPLPDGPPVGIGAGVALLLLGSLVGIEPRAHCRYLPTRVARLRARRLLVGIGAFGALQLLMAIVMCIGRVFTTGWPFALLAFADALLSALLLAIVIGSALLRDRTWFVFSVAAVCGLVLLAIGDDTLRLEFAAPRSAASGFVYLPTLFAAFGVMISRSFVRTMPVSFRRADWIVYAVRAFEFGAVMHIAAVGWCLLAALASLGGVAPAGPVMLLLDAAMCGCFAAVSLFARRALLHRPAAEARSSAVVAGVVLVVVGFLDVMVNSVASAAGAGLVTGAVALTTGIAAALMLTVPAPVRDEFGAPDLARMFAEFRSRDPRLDPVGAISARADAERVRRRAFPGALDVRASSSRASSSRAGAPRTRT